jgi:hypothetical protein
MPNKRDIKIRDPFKAEIRRFDTIKSSLMSYEGMDPNPRILKSKRTTTRNLTAVRKHNIYSDSKGKKDLIITHGKFFGFYFYSKFRFQNESKTYKHVE